MSYGPEKNSPKGDHEELTQTLLTYPLALVHHCFTHFHFLGLRDLWDWSLGRWRGDGTLTVVEDPRDTWKWGNTNDKRTLGYHTKPASHDIRMNVKCVERSNKAKFRQCPHTGTHFDRSTMGIAMFLKLHGSASAFAWRSRLFFKVSNLAIKMSLWHFKSQLEEQILIFLKIQTYHSKTHSGTFLGLDELFQRCLLLLSLRFIAKLTIHKLLWILFRWWVIR